MSRIPAVWVVLLALCAPVFAQDVVSIEGTVRTAAGAPAANVLVAAVPTGSTLARWAIAGSARTDDAGRFRITDLKSDTYALTITTPTLGAAFLERAETTKPNELTLAGGRKLTGVLRAPDGKPHRGRLLAARYSTFEGDLFTIETDDAGRFTAILPAARYTLMASTSNAQIEHRLQLETANAEVALAMERMFATTPPEVVAWIRQSAIPLKTAVAGHGFDDMRPLARVVGDARVVALGEATHGTREFFQLKHRMLEFLVREMGFTLFAIEASTPDTETVNEFVLHGKGDVTTATSSMRFWTWDTDEVADMIAWMRAYNADPEHTRKLQFRGFDMQNPAASATVLRAYLERVDPEQAAAFDAPLGPLLRNMSRYAGARSEHGGVRAAIEALAKRFDERRAAYIAKSTDAEYAWARRQIVMIGQAERMMASNAGSFEARDLAMAENAKWLLDREPAGTKMVLWAHNGHVAAEPPMFAPNGSMGVHLRRMYGDAVRIFGFAFDRGSFQAIHSSDRDLRAHTVASPPDGTFDAGLAAARIPLFALDLRTAKGVPREWVQSSLRHRSIGAVFGLDHEANYWTTIHPIRAYDAVFFVEQTTAARGRRKIAGAPMRSSPGAPRAVNLDFEESTVGDKPKGWSFGKPAEDAGFTVTTVDAGCASGKLCAEVTRLAVKGDGFASLAQKIDATAYRGKKVRFRAKVRSELKGAASSARLWLRVDRPDGKRGFFDNMQARDPGPLANWTELEIVGDVAGDADAVAFGLLFLGEGIAWMDAASIEVVP